MAKEPKKKKGGLLSRLRSTKQTRLDPELMELLDDVQGDPTNMRSRRKLADYYIKRNEPIKALDQYLTVAETYAEKGFYPKAVAVYKQAIQIDPKMIEVYLKLANLYHKLGLMPEVVEQYQKAAGIYEEQGKERESLDIRRMLLDLDPTNVVGRLKLGQRYLGKGYTQEAVNEFLRAADIFEKQGKDNELQKLLEGVLDRRVENFDVLYRLVSLYRQQNRPDLALARLAKLTGELAGSSSTLELTAELAEELGKPEVAVKALERAGGLYETVNRQDKVSEICHRIVALDPENVYAEEHLIRLSEEVTPTPPVEEQLPEEEKIEGAEDIGEEVIREVEEAAVEEIAAEELAPEPEMPEIEEMPVEEVSLAEEEMVEPDQPEIEVEIDEIAIEEEPTLAEEVSEIEEIQLDEIEAEEAVVEPEVEEIVAEEIAAEEAEAVEVEEIQLDEIEAEEAVVEPEVEEIVAEEIAAAEELAVEEAEAVEVDEIEAEEAVVEPEVEEIAAEELAAEVVEVTAAEVEEVQVEALEAEEAITEPVEEAPIEEIALEEALEPEEEEAEEEGPEQIDLAAMSEEEAEQRLEEAIDIYMKYGLRNKAVEYLTLALEQNPDSLTVLEKMMVVHRDGGDEEKAGEVLDRLIDLAQEQGRRDKLEQYLSQLVEYSPEDLAAADRLAEHYVESEPERAIVHFFELANRYRELSRYDDAEYVLERILEIDPQHETVHQELLDIFEESGEVDKAAAKLSFLADQAQAAEDWAQSEEYLRRLVEMNPMDQQANEGLLSLFEKTGESGKQLDLLDRLANQYIGAGELDAANDYYQRSLAIDESSISTHEKLKDLYLEMDQNENALQEMFNITRLATQQREHGRAIDSLREVFALDPDNQDAHEQLRDIYIEAGDTEYAIQEIMALAKIANEAEDTNGALAHLDQILQLAPGHEQTVHRKVALLREAGRENDAVAALYTMAADMERQGHIDKAESALREIIEIDETSLRAREALKELFLIAGLTDKAIAELVTMAETAEAAGETEAALTYWGEVCGMDPDHVRAREGIAHIHLELKNITNAVAEMLAIADIYKRREDVEGAIDVLGEALGHDAENEIVIEQLVELYGATGRTEKAVDLLADAGESAKAGGRLEQAIRYFAEVLELAPENIDLREHYCGVLESDGRTAEAVEQMLALAELYTSAGEVTRVEETYRHILEIEPGHQQAALALKDHYLSIGRLDAGLDMLADFISRARREGQLEKAQQFAEEMLAASEDERRALLTMAEIAVIAGDIAEAGKRYLHLAKLAEQDDHSEETEKYLHEVLELDADNVEAHRWLKELLLARDDQAGAIEHILALADVAVKNNDTEQAEKHYREILSLDEGHEPTLEHLVNLFVAAGEGEVAIPEMFVLAGMAQQKGDYAKAEKNLSQILDLDPDNEEAIGSLSQVHIAAGDTGQAISEIFTLVAAAEGKKDWENALGHVNSIVELEADNLSALSKKAEIQQNLGQQEEAIDSLLQLAEVYQEKDLLEDGERALRRIIKVEPEHEKAHEKLLGLLQLAESPRAVVEELLRFHNPAIEAGDQSAITSVAERILEIDDKFERAHRMLADVYIEQNEDEQAIGELSTLTDLALADERESDAEGLLKEIMSLDAVNAKACDSLREMYLAADRTEEAIRLLLSYGDSLQKEDRFADAREQFERVIEQEEGNEQALRKLKEAFLAEEMNTEAAQVLLRAVDAYDARGEAEKSVSALEEILSLDAYNEAARDDLKGRYLETGQKEKAVDLLFAAETAMADQWDGARREANIKEVLSVDPANEKALKHLVGLYKEEGEQEKAISTLMHMADLHAEAGKTEEMEQDLRLIIQEAGDNIAARQRLVDLYREREEHDALVEELFELAHIHRETHALESAQNALLDIVDLGIQKERALRELVDVYQASGEDDKQLDARFQLAATAFEQGNYNEAEAAYLDILGDAAENLRAREALISLYAETDRPADGAAQAMVLADRSRKEGNPDEAIKRYEQVLNFDTGNTKARRHLKKLLVKVERTDEAIKQMRTLADMAKEKQEYETVEDALREMLQYEPDDLSIRNELIELYEQTGQADKSEVELLEMSRLYAEAGEGEKALELAKKATALQPENPAALADLKDAYLRLDKKEEAVEALFRLCNLNIKARKRHTAESCLREILAIDPENTDAKEKVFDLFKSDVSVEEQIVELLSEAEEAHSSGRREDTIATLNKILSIDSEQPEALVRLKAVYAETKTAAKPAFEEEAVFEETVAEAENEVFQDVDLSETASDTEEEIVLDWGEPGEIETIVAAEPTGEEKATEEDVFADVIEEAVEDVDVFAEIAKPAAEVVEPEEPVVEADVEFEAEPEPEIEPVAEAEAEVEEHKLESVEVSIDEFLETGDVPKVEAVVEEEQPIEEKPEEPDSRILEDFRQPVTGEPAPEVESVVADLLSELEVGEPAVEKPAEEEATKDLVDEILGRPKEAVGEQVAGDSLDELIGDLGAAGHDTQASEMTDEIFESFVASLGDQAGKTDTAQKHYELGIAFREMDSIEEAITEFEKALAKDDGKLTFEINQQLGQCYASFDKFEMAVEYLETAFTEGVEDEQVMLDLQFDLGVCLKKIGMLNEAKKYFTQVDAQSSNYRGAKAEIADCEKGPGKKGKKKKKGEDDDNIGFL